MEALAFMVSIVAIIWFTFFFLAGLGTLNFEENGPLGSQAKNGPVFNCGHEARRRFTDPTIFPGTRPDRPGPRPDRPGPKPNRRGPKNHQFLGEKEEIWAQPSSQHAIMPTAAAQVSKDL